MRPFGAILLLAALAAPVRVIARLDPAVCGTHVEKTKEQVFLHRQAARRRVSSGLRPLNVSPREAAKARDIGQIALIDDNDGVVARQNPFDLNQRSLRFSPTTDAASYRFELGHQSYDADAAQTGQQIKLGDDDSQAVALPFAFPFFGNTYQQIYLNSDGNATFTANDAESTDRSFGRFIGGVPRIAPLFTDLDPSAASGAVFVKSEPERFVVSWVSVSLYADGGFGWPQTFQMRLYPDGRIEFAWADVNVINAVVGIAPGRSKPSSTALSFTAGSEEEFSSAVGEIFAGADAVDIVAASQKFYATHEDAYDYLVIFNSESVSAGLGVVAYEVTVRNQRTGYGDATLDIGRDFGSRQRLQSVLNMGPLSQYPIDPNAVVPARFLSRDTPLTVIGHEAGHLFLAFASVKDPANPQAKPMLGRQLAHWSFLFNSEASLLEGNRIQDNGPGASPRFTTVGTVQGYAPLDQYLMGFRAAEDVPTTFVVTDSPVISSGNRSPQNGVSFNGNRRDITVDDLVQVVGRRTPDHTVSQRRFRFGFLLIVPAGATPSDSQLAQLDTYRAYFEGFYQQATSDRASADATLKRALHLSAFPALGLLNGATTDATLTLDAARDTDLDVTLSSESGLVGLPATVTIPVGASQITVPLTGLAAGVDSIRASINDDYETAFAKIQVQDSAASLRLHVDASGPDVVLRVTDINNLPYPNIAVHAEVSSGSLDSPTSVSDANGNVRFAWSPADPPSELTASIPNGPTVVVSLK